MSEVRDPEIKLFGRTISLPHGSEAASSSSSSPHVVCSATQKETEDQLMKELTSVQDDDATNQSAEDLKSPTASSGISENPKTPSSEKETSVPKSSTNGEQSEAGASEEKTLKKPDKILPCPRCDSMDTKFCYYNNYNVNQPRHFCKKCQRYWTAGGTMRNVPVGAGRRKSKSSSASLYHHIMLPEALRAANLNAANGSRNPVFGNGAAVLSFGADSPYYNSVASALNIAEKTNNGAPNAFHATDPLVSQGKQDEGNDQSVGVSVTTSTSSERRGHADAGSHESVDKRAESIPPQLPYFPSAPWPYPWNSPQWNSAVPPAAALGPPGYPVSIYAAAAYWGGIPTSWNMPCMPPQSFVDHSASANSSGTISPTLGKHSRDGNVINPANSPKGKPDDIEHKNSESGVLIPKTLRIDDASDAAKSSIWSTLGIKNEKANSLNGGGGLFKPIPSKANDMNHIAEASPALHANPAALSRSLTFHENT